MYNKGSNTGPFPISSNSLMANWRCCKWLLSLCIMSTMSRTHRVQCMHS